nr:hypothetical protein GCM10020093_029380 [Planobispora longispora]
MDGAAHGTAQRRAGGRGVPPPRPPVAAGAGRPERPGRRQRGHAAPGGSDRQSGPGDPRRRPGDGPVPPRRGVSGDEAVSAQPLLDDQARRAYQERLSQLEAEIEEFESLDDAQRAAASRAERDWLLAELAAATGLGGRARRFSDSEERARIAVGKAVRRALARVTASSPVIGEELRATVHTGLRCSYHPR